MPQTYTAYAAGLWSLAANWSPSSDYPGHAATDDTAVIAAYDISSFIPLQTMTELDLSGGHQLTVATSSPSSIPKVGVYNINGGFLAQNKSGSVSYTADTFTISGNGAVNVFNASRVPVINATTLTVSGGCSLGNSTGVTVNATNWTNGGTSYLCADATVAGNLSGVNGTFTGVTSSRKVLLTGTGNLDITGSTWTLSTLGVACGSGTYTVKSSVPPTTALVSGTLAFDAGLGATVSMGTTVQSGGKLDLSMITAPATPAASVAGVTQSAGTITLGAAVLQVTAASTFAGAVAITLGSSCGRISSSTGAATVAMAGATVTLTAGSGFAAGDYTIAENYTGNLPTLSSQTLSGKTVSLSVKSGNLVVTAANPTPVGPANVPTVPTIPTIPTVPTL